MTTSANRIEEIFEEIFRDARELQADALEMLTQGRRNAAEKSWGATKRTADALILARTGEDWSGRPRPGQGSVSWNPWTRESAAPTGAGATMSARPSSTARVSTTACAIPLEDTDRWVRRTSGYIDPVAQRHHGHFPGHFPGDCRGQFPQQFHHRVHPGPALVGAQDAPGHGNGATPADHADDAGGGVVPLQRGVNRRRQPAGAPPGKDPSGQRREAETHVQFGPAGTRPVAAVVQPLPETLTQAVPVAPGGEGGRDGILAGAPGRNGPADPPGQAGQLGLSEVR